ncbi:hypothetical protein [Paenibacillus sp. IITD108]|uniref:hypothetical protein n=1 Tax=Paenibacillus sp. IITD108 TaxID=3116649 RepID=UPI002F3FFF63
MNYHSFIEELSTEFDPVIKKMRNQDPSSWIKEAWLGPLKSFKGLIRSAGVIGKIGWGSLPFIGPLLIAIGGYFASLPIWLIIVSTIIIIGIVYWIIVIRYTTKMVVMGHPNFHIGAFKAKRPTEYKFWAPFLQKHTATFGGLLDFITPIFTPNNGIDVKSVIEYTKGHLDAMQSEMEQLRSAQDYLQLEVEKYEQAVGYLVEMVKAINKSLFRLANDCMDYNELDFICAYTIYKVEDDSIYKVHDKGTSGISPKKILLTKENADKYAAVYVAMLPEGEDGFSYNNPYPGRTVASYRMNIYGEVWIWNFHFDDSNDKALKLTLTDDIIEIREVYRLVHAFCLVLYKRENEGKEGIHDGNDRSQKAN